MTDQDRDRDRPEGRPRVKVTDKRRTRQPSEKDPAAPPPSTRGVDSGDAAGSHPADVERRGDSEGTPLVTGEPPSRSEVRGNRTDGGEPIDDNDLAKARAEAAEYLNHLQRLKAEFDNYRKRVLREQTRAVEMAAEGLVARLLEVLDEFELALVAAGREGASDRLAKGVELVYAKLLDTLKAEGLERIEARGKPFDPELHEALLQSDGGQEGEAYVEDVLRTGYTLKGRILRPAGVKVGRR
jgi:molecular chaperone GrpE